MKNARLLLAALTLCSISAFAEEPPDLPLIKITTDLVQAHSTSSLAGSFAIVLRIPENKNLSGDSDLGPFIASAIANKETAVVLIVPPKAGTTHAVFFHGILPVFYSSRSDAKPAIDENREKVETIAEGKEELYFQQVKLTADDGTPIPAQRILSAGQHK